MAPRCLQVYNGLPDAVRGIISQRGFKGLYSGLGVTLLEIVPYAALQFGFYDAFTSAYAAYRKKLQPQVCPPQKRDTGL